MKSTESRIRVVVWLAVIEVRPDYTQHPTLIGNPVRRIHPEPEDVVTKKINLAVQVDCYFFEIIYFVRASA